MQTGDEVMIENTKAIFTQLSRIDFNHIDRTDRQQVFMEPLEVVATAIQMKPASVFGQSGYNAHFLCQLENFSEQNRLHTIRTPEISVGTQLLFLKSPRIPPSVLAGAVGGSQISGHDESTGNLLWIFASPPSAFQSKIRAAASGNESLGTLLGYPDCCTNNYLCLEEKLFVTSLDFYTSQCDARTDTDISRLLLTDQPLTGAHAVKESEIIHELRLQQAHSIGQFPFIHFIACGECMRHVDSPAGRLNKSMSDLAISLSKTFARKFTDYAKNYFEDFENYDSRRRL
jgi:hypothetical protein